MLGDNSHRGLGAFLLQEHRQGRGNYRCPKQGQDDLGIFIHDSTSTSRSS